MWPSGRVFRLLRTDSSVTRCIFMPARHVFCFIRVVESTYPLREGY
jgi:hypothetical protein